MEIVALGRWSGGFAVGTKGVRGGGIGIILESRYGLTGIRTGGQCFRDGAVVDPARGMVGGKPLETLHTCLVSMAVLNTMRESWTELFQKYGIVYHPVDSHGSVPLHLNYAE